MRQRCSKRKSNIHPSTPSSSHPLSLLHLVPPALLTIVSLLSPSDCEVLAYLILRSLQNPTTSKPKPRNKKCDAPVFDCGCFDCYTSFWIRWDSSPNRELIHQAIEAFEDNLNDICASTHKANPQRVRGECSTQTKKENAKKPGVSVRETEAERTVAEEREISEGICNGGSDAAASAAVAFEEGSGKWSVWQSLGVGSGSGSSRGLVRKVWPDVLGLFNSRLWSLWGPNL